MYVLDTATATEIGHGKNKTLNHRVKVYAENISLPIIAAQELINGRFRVINNLRPDIPIQSAKIPNAFQELLDTHNFIMNFPILPYTLQDEQLYQTFSPAVKRVGLNDCRIAAIAINRSFTVVTPNIKHFEQIPNVRFVDWTITDF